MLKRRYSFEAEDLKKHLDDAAIPFVDMLEYFVETGSSENELAPMLYWSRDFHHNAEGYARFAEGLEAYLRARGLIPEVSSS